MPESVSDRPTCAHEYLFLLAKRPRYYYDAEAITEPTTGGAHSRGNGVNPKAKVPAGWDTSAGNHWGLTGRYSDGVVRYSEGKNERSGDRREAGFNDRWRVKQNESFSGAVTGLVMRRNRRTVWTIKPEAFTARALGFEDVDHFATYPTKLVEPCILAGTSEAGVCPACGAPWLRVVDRQSLERHELPADDPRYRPARYAGKYDQVKGPEGTAMRYAATATRGWRPSCACPEHEPIGAVVLDPFAGSGTTLAVAVREGRRALGVELNPRYVEIAERRIAAAAAQPRLPLVV